jgi:hypothetical protein
METGQLFIQYAVEKPVEKELFWGKAVVCGAYLAG